MLYGHKPTYWWQAINCAVSRRWPLGLIVTKPSSKHYQAASCGLSIRKQQFSVAAQVLHLVDFEQLKIENQQYFERIDGKNKELLQLKLSTGKTVQVSTTPLLLLHA